MAFITKDFVRSYLRHVRFLSVILTVRCLHLAVGTVKYWEIDLKAQIFLKH